VGKKGVTKVALGLIPDGSEPFERLSPIRAALQVVVSFTYKLTITEILTGLMG